MKVIKLRNMAIAIDGPAAAGKSTVAKLIADACSYIYIDTGAMYRALTYEALQQKIDINKETELMQLLTGMEIELKPSNNGQKVFVNSKDVTDQIRSNEVTTKVSVVAKHRQIREEMVQRQRQMAKNSGVVMDGRDIGTEVLPNAEVKVFLLASVDERAKRRHDENISKGYPSNLEQLKIEITERDRLDTEREVSPLQKADDAIEIDTTSLTIEEVVSKILKLVQEREKNEFI
jgi:cytidylate kinase